MKATISDILLKKSEESIAVVMQKDRRSDGIIRNGVRRLLHLAHIGCGLVVSLLGTDGRLEFSQRRLHKIIEIRKFAITVQDAVK